MTSTDLCKRDCYRFVTNLVVGKWPEKGSLRGGTEEKFPRRATENGRRIGTREVKARSGFYMTKGV